MSTKVSSNQISTETAAFAARAFGGWEKLSQEQKNALGDDLVAVRKAQAEYNEGVIAGTVEPGSQAQHKFLRLLVKLINNGQALAINAPPPSPNAARPTDLRVPRENSSVSTIEAKGKGKAQPKQVDSVEQPDVLIDDIDEYEVLEVVPEGFKRAQERNPTLAQTSVAYWVSSNVSNLERTIPFRRTAAKHQLKPDTEPIVDLTSSSPPEADSSGVDVDMASEGGSISDESEQEMGRGVTRRLNTGVEQRRSVLEQLKKKRRASKKAYIDPDDE